MHDASMIDAQVAAEVARDRLIHDTKFAFLGDRAPPFDAELATLVATTNLRSGSGGAVRDSLLSARYLPDMTDGRATADAARADMIRDMTAQSTGDVRDAIRNARFR